MTEQQLAEIEQRWVDNEVTMQTINDFNLLLAEVRRLNRMVDKAVDRLEHGCCDAAQSFDCEETNRDCRDCWKEYLESEVAE